MTSGPYLVEGLIKQVWPGYDVWADQYIASETRRRFSTWLAIFGGFVAGFLAFSDEHEKLQQAQAKERAQEQQFQAKLQEAQSQFAAVQSAFTKQANSRSRIVSQLSKFHGDAMDLLSAEVTKDQLPLWKEKQETLASDAASWVESTMGVDAKSRLLDMGGFTSNAYAYVKDPDQRGRLVWLEKFAHNIFALMQDEVAASSPR